MAYHALHSWTLCGLIGAFIDLALAYVLLCGSFFVFFPTKLANLFGLYLPCPCSGILGYQDRNLCLHKLLTDCPTILIASVQELVKSRFPFNFIWFKDQGCNSKVKASEERRRDVGSIELEGEASRNFADKETGYDAKGKKILYQKQRSGMRRRRRVALGFGKLSGGTQSPRIDCEINESLDPLCGIEDDLLDDGNNPNGIDRGKRTCLTMKSKGDGKGMAKDSPSIEKFICNAQYKLGIATNEVHANKPGIDGDEANAIRMLEQALEEEKVARAALFLELEKERAAAATAADEAMGMILRLQEDKASIEMEARQYQRMIEEKFAYDEEEMSILKEIIVRREKENHVLEKKVEAYRQLSLLGSEQSEGDLSYVINKGEHNPTLSLNSDEDPLLMLQQIENGKSTANQDITKNAIRSSNYECTLALGEEIALKNKELPSDLSTSQGLVNWESCQSNPSVNNLHGKNVILDGEKVRKDNNIACQGMTIKTDQSCNGIEKNLPCSGVVVKKAGEAGKETCGDMHNTLLDAEPTVYDVHVIDDMTEPWRGESGKENATVNGSDSDVWRAKVLRDYPGMSMPEAEPITHESSLDTYSRIPMLYDPQCKTVLLDSGRKSSSIASGERLKIDIEVEWLWERLRMVQEEKEKLTLSAEHSERVNTGLKLVEEIVKQLQEIQQLKEPDQLASLPP